MPEQIAIANKKLAVPERAGILVPENEISNKDKVVTVDAGQLKQENSSDHEKDGKTQKVSHFYEKIVKPVRDKLPLALHASSSIHLLTALGSWFQGFLPNRLQTLLEKHALKFSKTSNALNYGFKAVDAFAKGRGFDAFGRAMYSLLVPFVPLEDIFLAAGLSSGPTEWFFSLKQRVPKTKGVWDDIKQHLKEAGVMMKEILEAGFGSKRVILKEFGAEEPHTLFFAGTFNMIGALFGLIPKHIFGLKDGPAAKFVRFAAGFLRNVPGGILSDYAKLFHPDKDCKKASVLYLLTSILDVSQTLVGDTAKVTLNHLNQFLNNTANHFFTNMSSKVSDGAFEDFSAPKSDQPETYAEQLKKQNQAEPASKIVKFPAAGLDPALAMEAA